MSAVKSKEGRQGVTLEQRINQIFAVLWVLVGVVVVTQARDLEYVAEYGPGPGFLPYWMGMAFILLGLALLGQVTFSRQEREALSLPTKHAAWQMLLLMLGFFGFALLGERIGFLLGIGLLFLFLLVAVERKGWKASLTISIINTLAFWAIFELGLTLRLPAGFLDLWR